MAQGKKDSAKASQKKKAAASSNKASAEHADEAAEAKAASSEENESTKSAEEESHKADSSHGGHDAHAALAAHGHHAPNRKEYMYVFLALGVLTVIEVAVAQVPGLSKTLLGIALVGLAVTKAAIVGLYYMHLKHETQILRLTVAIPLMTPAVYALVLISEGAWRLAR